MRIHQGKRKCGQKGQQQPCTALAGETRGTESQVENHRADGPNVAEGKDVTEEEGPLVEGEPPHEYQDPVATNSHRAEPKAETKTPTRRGKLKWPKASETNTGHRPDQDTGGIFVRRGGIQAQPDWGHTIPGLQEHTWRSDLQPENRPKREGKEGKGD